MRDKYAFFAARISWPLICVQLKGEIREYQRYITKFAKLFSRIVSPFFFAYSYRPKSHAYCFGLAGTKKPLYICVVRYSKQVLNEVKK